MRDLGWYNPKWVGSDITEIDSLRLYQVFDLVERDCKQRYWDQELATLRAKLKTEIDYRETLIWNQLEGAK